MRSRAIAILKARTHEAFVVAVTESGGSVIKSRGQVDQAHPSALFVFNPVEPHAGWMGANDRWRYRSLYLTQAATDAVADALGIEELPYFERNLFSDPDLIGAFLGLHHALEEGRDVFQERELLVGTFGRLFRRHGSHGGRIREGPCDRALLDRAISIMRDRYDEELRLDDICTAVSLTPFQLIGLFRTGIGLTPYALLTQIRLQAACRHLRRGMPIALVAASVGFCDQSALTKHFKRSYAITPLQFAKAALDASGGTRGLRKERRCSAT